MYGKYNHSTWSQVAGVSPEVLAVAARVQYDLL